MLGLKRNKNIIPISNNDSLILPEDVLFIIGREEQVSQLKEMGLTIKKSTRKTVFESKATSFAELLVPARSNAAGKSLKELDFRANYGFTAVALWRADVCYRTNVAEFALEMGDTILLIGPNEKLNILKNQQDFIVLETSPSKTGLDKPSVLLTLAIFITALTAMLLGTPIEITMFSAAVLILLTRLLSPEEAYRAINWRAVFLIMGTLAVSLAMMQTELAQVIGDKMVSFVEPYGDMGLVVGTYLLSAGLHRLWGLRLLRWL